MMPEDATKNYPLFEMKVGGERKWLSFRDASITYDSGWIQVEFGSDVIDKHGSLPRRMTSEEKMKIQDAADEYSASK